MNIDKQAYPCASHLDEWNPHIVRHLADNRPEAELSPLASKQEVFCIESKMDSFHDMWHSAQRILNDRKDLGIYPLAYRLEPVLSKPLDSDLIEGTKFGGLPDFRRFYSFGQGKHKKLDAALSGLWPRCGGCGGYMRFLGGFDMSEWMLAIHLLTANNPTHTHYGSKIGKSDIHYHQHSGLGFGKDLGADSWPLNRVFWNIFYCEEPHFDKPNSDSTILVEHRYGGCHNVPLANARAGIMSTDDYRDVAGGFVKARSIGSNIPLQSVESLALRFDVDIPSREYPEDLLDELTGQYPDVFGHSRDAHFHFFGRPASQQNAPRYFCQNSYIGPHRMAPLVNWTDHDADYTYQVYACLRCMNDSGHRAYGKTDGSCT